MQARRLLIPFKRVYNGVPNPRPFAPQPSAKFYVPLPHLEAIQAAKQNLRNVPKPADFHRPPNAAVPPNFAIQIPPPGSPVGSPAGSPVVWGVDNAAFQLQPFQLQLPPRPNPGR